MSDGEFQQTKRVAVIGGGITGLAAAHRMRELDDSIEVTLFDVAPALGGVLQTTKRDGYLIEHAADNFITNVPWGVELCRRIGFDDQLIHTDDRYRKAFVVHQERLWPIPEGFALMAPARMWPVLTTPILSWQGKLRLAWEYFTPRREVDDESLESFATRRLGKEVYERIVQPLVGGIYTADPTQLSLAATLPRFLEMERDHGGLIRGALKQSSAKKPSEQEASGARYSLFVAPRNGMSSFVDALAARLPAESIRLNIKIDGVSKVDTRWRVQFSDQRGAETFDHVLLATGAPTSSKLLAADQPALASDLAAIPYAGASVVCLGYAKSQVEHPLDGFGFVVPSIAGRRILAGSFSSVKYEHRAPDGHVLIRVFVGGALQPELAALPDDELIQLVREELGELIGAQGEPDLCHISRWNGAMPQYHLGHLQLVEKIEQQVHQLPGLAIAGNAFHGVGIPQCIRSGETAAEQVIATSNDQPLSTK